MVSEQQMQLLTVDSEIASFDERIRGLEQAKKDIADELKDLKKTREEKIVVLRKMVRGEAIQQPLVHA